MAILICTASFPVIFTKNSPVINTVAEVFDMGDTSNKIKAESKEKFRIKLSSSEIKEIPAEEYVIGVLCGEISPSYNEEAIKAQAVAAYTFAVRRSAEARKNGRDYDLTDSPSTDQCFTEKTVMYEKWGDKADEYYKIFSDAVKKVSGQMLLYDDSPALTVYHAMSSGMTNSSKDVWGSELPYLVSVESVGDKLAKGYLSEVTLTEAEVADKMKDICTVQPGSNAFENMNVSESGRVISAEINGKTVKGGEIASALSLKSGNFEVSYAGGNYCFTVKGSGHGVGMSQQGALYMAKQGSSYEEILLHYYKGCKLKK